MFHVLACNIKRFVFKNNNSGRCWIAVVRIQQKQ